MRRRGRGRGGRTFAGHGGKEPVVVALAAAEPAAGASKARPGTSAMAGVDAMTAVVSAGAEAGGTGMSQRSRGQPRQRASSSTKAISSPSIRGTATRLPASSAASITGAVSISDGIDRKASTRLARRYASVDMNALAARRLPSTRRSGPMAASARLAGCAQGGLDAADPCSAVYQDLIPLDIWLCCLVGSRCRVMLVDVLCVPRVCDPFVLDVEAR